MGVDYSLACNDCKVFKYCYRWAPVEEAGKVLYAHFYPQYGVPASSFDVTSVAGCPVVRLDASGILKQMPPPPTSDLDDRHPQELLFSFVREHGTHDLFLACDIGGEPWSWDVPDAEWTQWKEVADRDCFSTFLPRYLVEDLRMATWDEVLEFLKTEHHWLLYEQTADAVGAIRVAFERAVAARDRS